MAKHLLPLSLYMRSMILLFSITILMMLPNAYALELSDKLRGYLAHVTVSDNGGLSGSDDEVRDFLNFVQTNWAEILPQIEVVAPKVTSQEAIVAAAEYLSGKDYVTFLSGLLDKVAANKIDPRVAVEALSGKTAKQGFLAYNYQHHTVRALCERAKILFSTHPDAQRLIGNILSGDQKRQSGAALAMERRAEPEILTDN